MVHGLHQLLLEFQGLNQETWYHLSFILQVVPWMLIFVGPFIGAFFSSFQKNLAEEAIVFKPLYLPKYAPYWTQLSC